MKTIATLIMLLMLCSCSKRVETDINPGEFQIVYGTKQVPQPSFEAVAALWPTASPGIADPTQPFQATDQISSKTLPYRRLIFATISDTEVLIVYERGGGAGIVSLFCACTKRQNKC